MTNIDQQNIDKSISSTEINKLFDDLKTNNPTLYNTAQKVKDSLPNKSNEELITSIYALKDITDPKSIDL